MMVTYINDNYNDNDNNKFYINSFSAIGEYRYFCGRHRSRSDCTERIV